MQRYYRIICEQTEKDTGIKVVKQLYTWDSLEADTLAAEYISQGWHVTIDVEKHYPDNAPVADVISLFDRARQKKQFKEAKDILGEATARNIANKKRMEAERHRNNQNVLKAYDISKKGGKK